MLAVPAFGQEKATAQPGQPVNITVTTTAPPPEPMPMGDAGANATSKDGGAPAGDKKDGGAPHAPPPRTAPKDGGK